MSSLNKYLLEHTLPVQSLKSLFICCRGQTSNFVFTSSALGKLQCCILGAFEREDRPIGEVEGKEGKWLCDQVVVTDGTTGDR